METESMNNHPHPKLSGDTAPLPAGSWEEIPAEQATEWNRKLQATPAALYQYPFWNEPLRRLFFRPRYLVCRKAGQETGYTCILTMSFLGYSLGLIKFGPVDLLGGCEIPAEDWKSLGGWARDQKFVFLRVTHSHPEALATASSLPGIRRMDSFPLYPEEREELIVSMVQDEAAMLAGFCHEVRRQIRRAGETGYVIKESASPETMFSIWPLFEDMATRKKINIRPYSYFQDLVTGGTSAGCCRIYTAEINGKTVQAILVSTTGASSYFMAGALNVTLLPNAQISPSYLLHWHAMRQQVELGAKHYNIGNRAGPVFNFKKRFDPMEYPVPVPVTLVLQPFLFWIWSITVLKTGQPFLVLLRGLIQKIRK